ncbi:MAG: nuclear transport factor 2 family protein [Gemmatimonadota bacterium]
MPFGAAAAGLMCSERLLRAVVLGLALLACPDSARAQECALGTLPPAQTELSQDQRAIMDLVERFRNASFVSQADAGAEIRADSAARADIMAPDYLRLDWQGGVARSGQSGSVNEGVSGLTYEGVHVATYGATAVATYRSHYRFTGGWDTYLREVRVFQRADGRWRMVSGIGFPLCGWLSDGGAH